MCQLQREKSLVMRMMGEASAPVFLYRKLTRSALPLLVDVVIIVNVVVRANYGICHGRRLGGRASPVNPLLLVSPPSPCYLDPGSRVFEFDKAAGRAPTYPTSSGVPGTTIPRRRSEAIHRLVPRCGESARPRKCNLTPT